MRAAPLLLCVAAVHGGAAVSQELSYYGSIVVSSGSYIFTEPTTTFGFYNGIALTAGRVRLTGTLPILLQNSGAVTAVGGAYLPTGGKDHEAVGGRQQGQPVPMGGGGGKGSTLHGNLMARAVAEAADTVAEPGPYALAVGDPLVLAAIQLQRGLGALRTVEVTGALKPPINDLDSGVGTGEWDCALGAAAAVAVETVVLFVDGSYWWYGDLPGLPLRDGITVGGGLSAPVSGSISLAALATLGNRIIATAEPARSVALGISYRTSRAGTFSLTGGGGLSETTPDFTISIGWMKGPTKPAT